MEEAGTPTAPDAETEATEAVKGESLGRIATVTRVCTVSAFVL